MHKWYLRLNLRLHEDGAEVGGTSNDTPVNGSPEAQDPVVVYGKQGADTAAQTDVPGPVESSPSQQEIAVRQEAYTKAKEAYKDLYEEDIKGHLDRRLKTHAKESSELKSMLAPMMAYMDMDSMDQLRDFVKNTVMPEVKDSATYTKLAEAFLKGDDGSAIVPAEEVRQSPADLAAQAVALKESLTGYGVDFDYAEAVKAPEFTGLLDKGLSVQQAYFALNHEEILLKAGQQAAEAAKQATIQSVRTKGLNAVTESASKPTTPVVVKDNPSTWDDKDMETVIKRVMKGEKIAL